MRTHSDFHRSRCLPLLFTMAVLSVSSASPAGEPLQAQKPPALNPGEVVYGGQITKVDQKSKTLTVKLSAESKKGFSGEEEASGTVLISFTKDAKLWAWVSMYETVRPAKFSFSRFKVSKDYPRFLCLKPAGKDKRCVARAVIVY